MCVETLENGDISSPLLTTTCSLGSRNTVICPVRRSAIDAAFEALPTSFAHIGHIWRNEFSAISQSCVLPRLCSLTSFGDRFNC
jgi:hypothetical protein